MKLKLGLVTYHKAPDLIPEEASLIELFYEENIKAIPVIWDDTSVNWPAFDCLIIRSIWDYHIKYEQFNKWLDKIESSGIYVLNPITVIRKNIHKFYLENLLKKGIRIVPTHFQKKKKVFNFENIERLNWERLIIKPAVSASAYKTALFWINERTKIEKAVTNIQKESDVLIQKFIPEIRTNGELSIIFFNKKYAYTILKEATGREFRIQSEFGGTSREIEISQKTINTAGKILSNYKEDLLYARVDGLLVDDEFILMELELTEPSLFFELRNNGPIHFVKEAVRLIGKSII